MKWILIIFLLIGLSFATNSIEQIYPQSHLGAQNLAIYELSLEADENGSIDYTTPEIYGKLYAISWENDTTTAINGTIFLNSTRPYVANLENYNLSLGNATEYTRTSTLMYFLSGPLTLDCDNGTANETLDVWLYIEQ